MTAGDVEWCYGKPGEGMDGSAGTKLLAKLSRSWVPHSPRCAEDDQLCVPRSVLVQVFCVKKCQAGEKAISRTPMC